MRQQDFLNPDGSLKFGDWARIVEATPAQRERLEVDSGPQPHVMAHSSATGRDLLSNGSLGVDLIRVPANGGFQPHTHPGDHLLIVVSGKGTITYGGHIYPTSAGQLYMIEGEVPHAVGAITDHVILAVGSPHKPIGSDDRMTLVDYVAVTADLGSIYCLICDLGTEHPKMPHDVGCAHCPCAVCV